MSFRTSLLFVAVVLLAAFVAVKGWKVLFSGPRKLPPEKLAQLAVSAPTPEEKVKAASELVRSSDAAVEHMREVLRQYHRPAASGHNSPTADPAAGSQSLATSTGQQSGNEASEVKAMMITGLAQEWDFDSMPMFLEALDDESYLVRARAHLAVQRLLQVDVGYRPEDPPEIRRQYIQKFREEWQKMGVLIHKFKDRQKSGEQ